MIRKTPIKGSNSVSVTFETMAHAKARSVHLVGDFNDWDPTAHAMKRRKDGSWAITLRLAKHRDWQYRFVLDNGQWVDDAENDTTAPNPYGGVNAVVLT